MAAYGLDAVRQLGGVGLEKFAPGRSAKKQFFDLHRGALAARHGFELTGVAIQEMCGQLAASPR